LLVNDPASPFELPSFNLVQVWVIYLPDVQHRLESFHKILSPEESRRAARLVFEQDRRRYVLAHGVLRSLLARCLSQEPERVAFRYGPYGKPMLAGGERSEDLRFNLSHSGDYCLCAVALRRDVGVDIEAQRSNVECLQLAERFFTRREYETLKEEPDDLRPAKFLRYWTCKEAYLKARGIGISSGLARLEVIFNADGSAGCRMGDDAGTPDREWLVRSLSIGEHVIAAVAAEGTDWDVAVSRYPVK
jgi:4'-phosphopantetheinyl transferase